jgi:hypothetical protein
MSSKSTTNLLLKDHNGSQIDDVSQIVMVGMHSVNGSLNGGKIAADLEIVLKSIQDWKKNLPEKTTDESERILESIICVINERADDPHLVIAQLKRELIEEKLKRIALEKQVFNLQEEVDVLRAAAHDSNVVNLFQDAMSVVRNFVIRVEVNKNPKHQSLIGFGDKDIIESLFVDPVDTVLDTPDEIKCKTKLFNIADASRNLIADLGLNEDIVVFLYQTVQERNGQTHKINNKLHKDIPYIESELKKLITVVGSLNATSEYAPKKEELVTFFEALKIVHPQTVGKI